jgi:hypothetical protein
MDRIGRLEAQVRQFRGLYETRDAEVRVVVGELDRCKRAAGDKIARLKRVVEGFDGDI